MERDSEGGLFQILEESEQLSFPEESAEYLILIYKFENAKKKEERELRQTESIRFLYDLEDSRRVKMFESLQEKGFLKYDRLTSKGKIFVEYTLKKI